VNLFSSVNDDKQIGVEFQPAGVAIAQVQTGNKQPGRLLSSIFLPAVGQQAQAMALRKWVHHHDLQKCNCVCLMSADDFNIYQVEKPDVDGAELVSALTWRIKDLISYEISSVVLDFYSIPVSITNNTQQVNVVTAEQSTVATYVECIKSTGLKLVAIDITSLVGANLNHVQQAAGETLAVLSLTESSDYLNIYHDTDLYVSRDFKIGTSQLTVVTANDESTYESLLLKIQRSTDYFESYYGLGSISKLLIFPQVAATEKMATYLQSQTNFDIDFVIVSDSEEAEAANALDLHCFHAYGAALRGIER
jgi:MSHA biogenesis protein MshI